MVTTIQPREYFPIARVLPDPADTATYYVRAVIRNAKTNATIATVALDSQGSRIYAANWQAVADPSGQGLYITVTTEVYTDSGYTVVSDVYGQEQDTFLIFDREKNVQNLATQITALMSDGGNGVEVDYKKIEKIIRAANKEQTSQVIAAIPEIEAQEQQEVDLTPVLSAIQSLGQTVSAIDIPEQQETDLTPVLNGLSDIRQAIQTIKIPDPTDPVDLEPVMQAIAGMDKTILDATKEFQKDTRDLLDALDKLPDSVESIKEIKSVIYELLHKLHALKPLTAKASGPALNSFGSVVTRSQ